MRRPRLADDPRIATGYLGARERPAGNGHRLTLAAYDRARTAWIRVPARCLPPTTVALAKGDGAA